MKKWKVVAPLTLAALGAAAAGVVVLTRKAPTEAKAPAKAAKSAAPAAPKNLKTGSYSFISGFKDAVTVEMFLDYDADRFSFAVIAEDFLSYTSDSHVAVLYGEDFSAQIEYAGYYQNEGFEDLIRHVSEKFTGFGDVAYGGNTGIKYCDGDNICLCFPVDEHSYLLVTLVKAKGNDDDFTLLPDYPDVAAIFGSMRFQTKG